MAAAYISQFRCFLMALGSRLPAAGTEAAARVLSVAEALTNIVWAPMAEGLDSISLSANWMWPCRAQEGEDARLYTAVKALSDFCCSLQINVPTGKYLFSPCFCT